MESVLIVAKSVFGSVVTSVIGQIGDVSSDAEGVIAVESGGSRLFFCRNDSVWGELEDERIAQFRRLLTDPVIFTIDYHDIKFCKKFLALVANRSDVVVDNDFGTVLPGSSFVELLASRPEWDWRLDPPNARS